MKRILALLWIPVVAHAQGTTAPSGPVPAATPAPAPNSPKKPRAAKKTPPEPQPHPTPAGEPPAEAPSRLFPSWSPEGFAWGSSPVLGFRLTSDNAGALTQVEGGAMASVRGIPLWGENPGLSVAPSLGYALGYSVWNPKSGDVSSGLYQRAWGGLELPFLVKFFKQTLGVEYGTLWGEIVRSTRELTVSSDSAFLVLPFLSAHYTYTRDALFAASMDAKVSLSHDNWWHARLFTPVLNAYLDLGPGHEISYFFLRAEERTFHVAGSTTYLLARAGAEVLPRFLELDGQTRYAFDNKTSPLSLGGLRRPSDELSAPPAALGQPADSLVSSVFLGWKNAFWGMSLGYRYTLEVYNLSENDGLTRRTRSSQGFGLHAATRF